MTKNYPFPNIPRLLFHRRYDMRNPKRIRELTSLLEELWIELPDLRFNQLLYNLYAEYSRQNSDYGLVKEVEVDGFTKIGFDFFSLEDDEFIEYLRSKLLKVKYVKT